MHIGNTIGWLAVLDVRLSVLLILMVEYWEFNYYGAKVFRFVLSDVHLISWNNIMYEICKLDASVNIEPLEDATCYYKSYPSMNSVLGSQRDLWEHLESDH